jgi:hypothetical protein
MAVVVVVIIVPIGAVLWLFAAWESGYSFARLREDVASWSPDDGEFSISFPPKKKGDD